MSIPKIPTWLLVAGAGLGGGAIGFAIGFKAAEKQNKTADEPDIVETYTFNTTADGVEVVTESEKNKVIVEKVIVDEDFDEQIKAKVKLKKELQEIKSHDEEILSRPTNNVFVNNDGEDMAWNYETELANRKPTEPYVIHKDEFMENELEFQQETLTWYDGDEIMADQSDAPLWGWFDMMGTLEFGKGSDDPNVVYIRNETLHMEWEILRHTGRFEVEVGGFSIEEAYEKSDLKHSNSLHKFREY